jgi:ABC-type Fe3+/spermidine/putrescine transport system ATPase subunit
VSKNGLKLSVTGGAGPTTIVIRPVNIKITNATSGENHFIGRVESSNYYGATSRLGVVVSGETLLMEHHFSPGARPRVGDNIRIEIDPSGIRTVSASA